MIPFIATFFTNCFILTSIGYQRTTRSLGRIPEGSHSNELKSEETDEKLEQTLSLEFFIHDYIPNIISTLFSELDCGTNRWIIRQMTAAVVEAMKKIEPSERELTKNAVLPRLYSM